MDTGFSLKALQICHLHIVIVLNWVAVVVLVMFMVQMHNLQYKGGAMLTVQSAIRILGQVAQVRIPQLPQIPQFPQVRQNIILTVYWHFMCVETCTGYRLFSQTTADLPLTDCVCIRLGGSCCAGDASGGNARSAVQGRCNVDCTFCFQN